MKNTLDPETSAAAAGAGADAPRRGRPRGSYAKTGARRQEILKAAFEVFSTSGYRAGSLKDVADKVGLTQAGLLHHFPSKEALLEAVLTLRDEESVARTGSLTAKGADLLHGMVELVGYNATIPGLVALYTVLSAEADGPGASRPRIFPKTVRVGTGNCHGGLRRNAGQGHAAPGS